jgi:hypothetical protein
MRSRGCARSCWTSRIGCSRMCCRVRTSGRRASCICVVCSLMGSASRCSRWQIGSASITRRSSSSSRARRGLRGGAGQRGLLRFEAIGPDAYVIDDTDFPKDGKASPLVARMYSGTLGKTANCQIGVSVQLVTDAASLAANWRLYCPASWDDATVEPTRQNWFVDAEPGPGCPTRCGTGRSGVWRWTCSTR